jgi:hypothetical protein
MLAAEWCGRVYTKEKTEEKQDGRSKATPLNHDYTAVKSSQLAK